MAQDWFDEVDALVTAVEDGRHPPIERWAARLLDRAPGDAVDIVAEQVEVRMIGVKGAGPVSVACLRRLLADLLARGGDGELHAGARATNAQRTGRREAADAFLARPSETTWRALIDATPGDTIDDRVRRALYWLLVDGTTTDRVVTVLARRGPGAVLEPIARTALLSQFDFADRADRTRVPDRKRAWFRLAILAAAARGHPCCVGMFRLALEALEGKAGCGIAEA